MYKGKLKCWIVVALIAIVFFVAKNMLGAYEGRPAENSGAESISVYSDNHNLLVDLENKKLDGGTKVLLKNVNPDLYITEGKPIDGYLYEEYYSPIIACYNSEVYAKNVTVGYVDKRAVVELPTMLNGCIEGKKFRDVWSSSSHMRAGMKEIRVVVDENYEDEIKQVFLMSFAHTNSPTEEDCRKYAEQVNNTWDALEKTRDTKVFAATNSAYILITPEYNLPSSCYAVSIGDTVCTRFYINYKDSEDAEYKNTCETLARNNAIMKRTGIRRASYTGSYKKGKLKGSDWLMPIYDFNPEIAAYLKTCSDKTEEAANEDSADAETDIPDVAAQKSNEAAQGDVNNTLLSEEEGWDINKAAEALPVTDNRDIAPDAYAQD